MPTIVSHVRLVIPQEYLPADWVGTKWEEGLSKEAVRLNEKRQLRIPDRATFETRLAAPAAQGFAPMVKPDFHTKGGLDGTEVVIGQEANLRRSFDKYQAALDYVFETVDGVPVKRFKERVARKKLASKRSGGAGITVYRYRGRGLRRFRPGRTLAGQGPAGGGFLTWGRYDYRGWPVSHRPLAQGRTIQGRTRRTTHPVRGTDCESGL